jgi:anti-sigma regulatory factor (Ser/Thr protein kinase)
MPQTSPPTVRRRTARLEIDSDCARIAPTVNELTRDLRDLGWINEQVCYEVTLALTEALSNAVLHGNLEIASDVRERGIKSMLELAEQRRRAEPFASRRVRIRADCGADKLVYVIQDDGPGFDVGSVPDPTNCPADCLSGRGLLLIRAYMDRVEHNARGNQITLTKYLHPRGGDGNDAGHGNGKTHHPRRARSTRLKK